MAPTRSASRNRPSESDRPAMPRRSFVLRETTGRLPSETRLILIMRLLPDLADGEADGHGEHRRHPTQPLGVEVGLANLHAPEGVHQLDGDAEPLAQDLQ